MSKILDVQNLETSFQIEGKEIKLLKGVDFHINNNEIVGLVGESGSGKSLTSLSIMRLFQGTSGKISGGNVFFKDTNLSQISDAAMRKLRGKTLSMIFQEPMTSLNPSMKIGKQITESVKLHLKYSEKKAQGRAIELLNKVGIPRADEIIHEYPHQLSGGMRQRVMIAMAIACQPELLIADEPTTALDVTIQAQILNLLKGLQDESDLSILLITHDLGVVAEMCDRVLVMYAGKIVEEGTVTDLFTNPQHPYTQGLIDSVPKLGENQGRLTSIEGTVPSPTEMPKGCKFAPRCKFAMDICKEQEPRYYVNERGQRSLCWLHEKEGATDEQHSTSK